MYVYTYISARICCICVCACVCAYTYIYQRSFHRFMYVYTCIYDLILDDCFWMTRSGTRFVALHAESASGSHKSSSLAVIAIPVAHLPIALEPTKKGLVPRWQLITIFFVTCMKSSPE